jgi:hypothetical protein
MAKRLLSGTVLALLITACGGSSVPVQTGVSCADYGGCDVLLDLTDGTSMIIPLKAASLADATARALQESKRGDVLDAAVVGHDSPHIAVSGLYHH